MATSKELRFFLNPIAFIIVALAPQLILLGGGYSVFTLVASDLTDRSREAWNILTYSILASFLLSASVSAVCLVRKKQLPWHFAIPQIVLSSVWIYLFFNYCQALIPPSVPRWMLDPLEYFLVPCGLIMPSLLFGVLAFVYRITPPGSSGWKSFLGAVLLAVNWYLFFQWVLPSRTIQSNSSVVYFVVISGFAVSAVLFVVLLLRWMIVLARKPHWLWRITVRVLFGLVLPILGLYFNGSLHYIRSRPVLPHALYGDFSHPLFLVFTVLNGVFLLVPDPENRGGRIFVLALRCAFLPFSFYFFVVFLPLLPLALLTTLLAGFGLLILCPIPLFLIHCQSIWSSVVGLGTSVTRGRLLALIFLSFAIIPASMTTSFAWDRWILNQALLGLRSPNYESGAGAHLDRIRLTRVLDTVSRYKERDRDMQFNFIPLIDTLYSRLLFDRTTLSDSTIESLSSKFEIPNRTKITRRRNDYPPAQVKSWHVETTSTAEMMESTLTLNLAPHGNSQTQHEFRTEFELPAGTRISNLTLDINGERVQAQLTERSSAEWIYQQVTSRRQDPALLHYSQGDFVKLLVFPVSSAQNRVVTISFLHRTPFTLKIDNIGVPIGKSANAPTFSEATIIGNLAYIPSNVSRSLPRITRTPYFHFIVECAEDHNSWQSEVIRNFLRHHEFKALNGHSISIGSMSFVQRSLDIDDDWTKAIQTCKRDGAFNIDYAMKSMLLNAGMNPVLFYPVPVIISKRPNTAMNIIRDDAFDSLVPELRYVVHINEAGKSSILDQYLEQSNDTKLSNLLSTDPVRAWPSAESPKAFLKDSSFDSEVFVFREKPISRAATMSRWEQGLALKGQWLHQKYFPQRTFDGEWLDLIRQSTEGRLLTPATAFIVLETEIQREALRRRQEDRLGGRRVLDAGEMARMDEPGLGPLILVAIVACLRNFFWRNYPLRRNP